MHRRPVGEPEPVHDAAGSVAEQDGTVQLGDRDSFR